MNCHNSNDPDENNQHVHQHGHMSHMLMMMLCCGAPLLILLVVLPLLGSNLPGLKAVLISIAPFICPLMMVGMIPMMLRHGKGHDNHPQERQREKSEPLDSSERNRLN